jgi:uncharacterized RmlC-like cupin family protein
MHPAQPVTRVTPGDRVQGEQTPGMTREQAIALEGMWAGLVRTEAGMMSGWHHHGDYDTSIYVVRGSLRMESGPGGSRVVNAGPGDFLHVPKGAIHREGNPGSEESHLIVGGQGAVQRSSTLTAPPPAERAAAVGAPPASRRCGLCSRRRVASKGTVTCRSRRDALRLGHLIEQIPRAGSAGRAPESEQVRLGSAQHRCDRTSPHPHELAKSP